MCKFNIKNKLYKALLNHKGWLCLLIIISIGLIIAGLYFSKKCPQLSGLFLNLGSGVICSWVFYLIVVVVKEQSDRIKIYKHLWLLSRTIVNDSCNYFYQLILQKSRLYTGLNLRDEVLRISLENWTNVCNRILLKHKINLATTVGCSPYYSLIYLSMVDAINPKILTNFQNTDINPILIAYHDISNNIRAYQIINNQKYDLQICDANKLEAKLEERNSNLQSLNINDEDAEIFFTNYIPNNYLYTVRQAMIEMIKKNIVTVEKIFKYISFLDAQYIDLIARIIDAPEYQHIINCYGEHMSFGANNTMGISSLGNTLYEYLEDIRKIDRYSLKFKKSAITE
jgi:hypothetical protein